MHKSCEFWIRGGGCKAVVILALWQEEILKKKIDWVLNWGGGSLYIFQYG